MRKFFKVVLYFFASLLLVVSVLFAVAYWKRDVLLIKINEQLSQGIHGELHIGDLDFTIFNGFPRFSVILHKVTLRDSLFGKYQHNFFQSDRISLNVDLFRLLQRQIDIKELTIENGSCFVFRTKEGYSNLNLFKQRKPATDSSATEMPYFLSIRNLKFINLAVAFQDSMKAKYHSFHFLTTQQSISSNDSVYQVGITGSMHFDSLTFNQERGGFLHNKTVQVDLRVRIDQASKKLVIEPSQLAFEKSSVSLSGGFDWQPAGDFQLLFASKAMPLTEGKSLLNAHLNHSLRNFDISQPLSVNVLLQGKNMGGDQPKVDVRFAATKAKTRVAKLNFQELTFSGSFTNHVDSSKVAAAENSKVVVEQFEGLMDWIPVKGDVVVTEFKDPLIDLNVVTDLNLIDLNRHLDTTRYKFSSGKMSTVIKYSGHLSEYLNPASTGYRGILQGKSRIAEGTFYFYPRQLRLENLKGDFMFDREKLVVNQFSVSINGSPLNATGVAMNFIPFFIQPANKGFIKLNVSSPSFDLTALAGKKTVAHKTLRQVRKERKRISDLMDGIIEKLEFELSVNIAQLTFREFKAKDFSGKVTLTRNSLLAKPVTMKVAGGAMKLDFKLTDLTKALNPMTVEAMISNARIKDFFKSFDNFNQKTIGDQNLAGTISATAKFKAQLDDNLNIQPSSMNGYIECKIRDGRLIHFEPLENMSNFLFKNRDFSDVGFAELNSKFLLNGTALDIRRMEIQSSVLSLFLHGRYSFTDSTSLSIQLPLSNLKKRDKNFRPKNVGTDAKVGPSVFLHVYKDDEGKIAIAYDPFKKWAKASKQ